MYKFEKSLKIINPKKFKNFIELNEHFKNLVGII